MPGVLMGEGQRPRQDDAALIARAKAGEVEAFGELYERYFDPVFRYLRSRLSDEREAEDLSATVFLRAYQALDRYQERGWKFSAFLYGIARNALADHFRHRRAELLVADLESERASGSALRQDFEDKDSSDHLRRVLSELPPDYQEVIRLRLVLGLSTPEAAQWMRRSEGAVRVLLHRALRAARKRMTDDDEGRA
jgi:RNA polymerase sigma-70 factor (ECF subfamily)